MKRFWALFIVIIALGVYPIVADERNRLQSFQILDQLDDLRLVFLLDQHPRHNLFKLDNPSRIVVDFDNTAVNGEILSGFRSRGALKAIRFAAKKDGRLRVVFDVHESVDASSFVRTSESGNRVFVDLIGALAFAPETVSVATLQTSKPVTAEPKPRQPTVTKADKRAPEKSTAKPGKLRDLVVAIDAGHGGKDPGAIGKRGTYEKDIVLKVARDLAELLRKEPGYKPVLTRNSDVYLPLRTRIERARKQKADLFVSIHADAAHNRAAKGSSVFVLSQNGASSEAARMLAKRENQVDLIEGVDLSDADTTLAHVLIDLTQRHTIDLSRKAARSILKKLSKVGNVHGKRVEHAGFVVLKLPDIPSVLIETAFISNPSEEKRMRTRKHQKKVAAAIFKGIKGYFYQNAEPDTLIAQIRKREHIIRSGETLSGIAMRYRVSTSQLKRVNNLRSDLLRIGQKLKIPVSET